MAATIRPSPSNLFEAYSAFLSHLFRHIGMLCPLT